MRCVVFASFIACSFASNAVNRELVDLSHETCESTSCSDVATQLLQSHARPHRQHSNATSHWIVVTSINPATDAIYHLDKYAGERGWSVVVVGDVKGPSEWPNDLPRTKLFTIEEQRQTTFRTTKLLPEKSYTRKNLGYLYAMANGAEVIYETDDDNDLDIPIHEAFILPENVEQTSSIVIPVDDDGTGPIVANPYAYYGLPTVWPRGYPLDLVTDKQPEFRAPARAPQPYIQQGLVNGDPDVDAIFRLTRYPKGVKPSLLFDGSKAPMALAPGTLAPFNSQNTLFWRQGFPFMMIPKTVSFRACDIWRGYFAERLLWTVGGQLVYQKPSAFQERNSHSYLDDFRDEWQVYDDSGNLVQLLRDFRPTKKGTLFSDMMELAEQMATAGLWEQGDVEMLSAWLDDLRDIGIAEPETVNWEWQAQAKEFLR